MAQAPLNRVVRQLRAIVSAGEDSKLSDRDLLERFVDTQDDAAFSALVRRYGSLVLGACRRIVGDWHEAEDLFQATFFVLARKAGSIRKQQSLGNWLYGVAYRLALKSRKSTMRRSAREEGSAHDLPAKDFDDITVRELRQILDEELFRLPDKYREPLLLCYLEGKTQDEAARRLGWSANSIKGRLQRGRELLRSRLVRRGMTVSVGLIAFALAQEAAAVPPQLVTVTVDSSILFASGGATAAGALMPAKVAALADSFLKGIFMTKLKAATAVILATGVLASGSGLAAQKVLSDNGSGGAAASSSTQGDNKADQPKPEEKKASAGDEVDKALPATAVRLAYKDMPLDEALADFAEKSEYSFTYKGNKATLAKKITLNTDAVPFWMAFDKFCREAGLTGVLAYAGERKGAWNIQPGVYRRGVGAPAPKPAEPAPWSQHYIPRARLAVPQKGQLFLIEAESPDVPTCYAGALRIRALPPQPKDFVRIDLKTNSVTRLNGPGTLLELTPEPSIWSMEVLSLTIEKSIANQDENLAPEAIKPGFIHQSFMTSQDQVPLIFKPTEKPVKAIKELKGVVCIRIPMAPGLLKTVEVKIPFALKNVPLKSCQ